MHLTVEQRLEKIRESLKFQASFNDENNRDNISIDAVIKTIKSHLEQAYLNGRGDATVEISSKNAQAKAERRERARLEEKSAKKKKHIKNQAKDILRQEKKYRMGWHSPSIRQMLKEE